MTLLENWREQAYRVSNDPAAYDAFWKAYFEKEKGFYASLLADPSNVEGTVPELAEKYGVDRDTMVGILDGINDSLKEKNPIEEMDETTVLSLDYDPEKLYRNMVTAKADWLYHLPEWDSLLTEERRAVLLKEGRLANTVIREKKVGRNDPCPCGSGKKYKFCCGRS